ncbi:MAG TPA: hypothetical protein VNI84_20680 [Pyrinomonadaceae bacterium]|nr:hypothetical protein [Pyrinomonadaceae bacterium]
MVVSHGEFIEKFIYNDAELNAKISALIDAQIRSEDKISALVEAQNRNDEKFAALVEAQNRGEEMLQRLTGLVDKAHSRIDGLEN